MTRLSEQLGNAISFAPPDDVGLILRVVRLDNERKAAREAQGVLPVFVVGHEGMDTVSWRKWVREHAVAAYGSAMAERFVREGIDFKEFDPTRPFGRALRPAGSWRSESGCQWHTNHALYVLTVVEKWPSLYNLIATEMAEEDMTLGTFLDRVTRLPSPFEVGEGRFSTLGDLVSRNVVLTPNY